MKLLTSQQVSLISGGYSPLRISFWETGFGYSMESNNSSIEEIGLSRVFQDSLDPALANTQFAGRELGKMLRDKLISLR